MHNHSENKQKGYIEKGIIGGKETLNMTRSYIYILLVLGLIILFYVPERWTSSMAVEILVH